MNPSNIPEIVACVEKVATLMARWGLKTHDWCVLDGPAIKLCDNAFDSSSWRDHLNIYVREQSLPWNTQALELTVPPIGSAQLSELLEVTRTGTDIHLVPAYRYYRAGFERKTILLPSGCSIAAATLRGCCQVWSFKSAEIVENPSRFEGDVERIVDERLVRLRAALVAATETDIREQLVLLQNGYEALRRSELVAAKEIFERAAGPTWEGSDHDKMRLPC